MCMFQGNTENFRLVTLYCDTVLVNPIQKLEVGIFDISTVWHPHNGRGHISGFFKNK